MINIKNINTTILYDSKYNYNNEAIEMINKGYEVITKTSNVDIKNISKELLEEFDLLELQSKKNLTLIDEIKINLLSCIETNKDTIVFFNILTYTDNIFKTKLINKLKENNKRIINFTTDIEETLLLEYLIVLKDSKIIMEGNTKAVLNEEKILKKLGFNRPFIVELSTNLLYYNIVDKVYYSNESLVNDIWK